MPEQAAQIGAQRDSRVWDQRREARIAHQIGKLRALTAAHVLQAIGFEVAAVRLVESDEDSHDFAQAQLTWALACLQTSCLERGSIMRLKGIAEIVHVTEQFDYTHVGSLLRLLCF